MCPTPWNHCRIRQLSKHKTNYCRRVWLNGEDSEATGSVVAFDGVVERWRDRIEPATFLEVADCSGKVSLHRMPSDDMAEFVAKLRLLASVAEDFADFLEDHT